MPNSLLRPPFVPSKSGLNSRVLLY